MENNTANKKATRWSVFIPCFLVIGGAAILGLVNNQWLTEVTRDIFTWSLTSFGWLYQIVCIGNSDISGHLVIFQNRKDPFWKARMPKRSIPLVPGLP